MGCCTVGLSYQILFRQHFHKTRLISTFLSAPTFWAIYVIISNGQENVYLHPRKEFTRDWPGYPDRNSCLTDQGTPGRNSGVTDQGTPDRNSSTTDQHTLDRNSLVTDQGTPDKNSHVTKQGTWQEFPQDQLLSLYAIVKAYARMVVLCKLKILLLRTTVRHHSASSVMSNMPNSYPHDRIFNPHSHLTLPFKILKIYTILQG